MAGFRHVPAIQVLTISADRMTIRSGQFDEPPDFEHYVWLEPSWNGAIARENNA